MTSIEVLPSYRLEVTGIVISFNTCDLLRDCLQAFSEQCAQLASGVRAEILVVDNASTDGSAEMVEREFNSSSVPIRLIRSDTNLGFGGANNRAIREAQGRYLVLLNSDAFLHPGSLARALHHMDTHPDTGFGGARLVSTDGSWQPSARRFHSIWRDGLVMSGISWRYPNSRFLNPLDANWSDPNASAEVDWVPGAFMIGRREAIAKAGLFDERFFLYYEETDLCRRVKAAGFNISYWPDVVVTHLGGESSRQLHAASRSNGISRSTLWRMRSMLLYYRKHHGWQAGLAFASEWALYAARKFRNRLSRDPGRRERGREAVILSRLLHQAWKDTCGGRVSPPVPW